MHAMCPTHTAWHSQEGLTCLKQLTGAALKPCSCRYFPQSKPRTSAMSRHKRGKSGEEVSKRHRALSYPWTPAHSHAGPCSGTQHSAPARRGCSARCRDWLSLKPTREQLELNTTPVGMGAAISWEQQGACKPAPGGTGTTELTLRALQMSSSLWLLQLHLLTPCLHSPSWPVSVPSASCPVPCEWRKAPILADQAALCRTFAFFVGGFPYKRRNISGTGGERKPAPATGKQRMHLFPGGISE